MAEIIHRELSYKVVGMLYRVYNQLGGGYQEKIYKQALKKELQDNEIGFLEEVRVDLNYGGSKIGRYYLDFIVEHKIVLELKVTPVFTPRDFSQVMGYLKASGLELGILASLNKNNIIFKRILRGRSYSR